MLMGIRHIQYIIQSASNTHNQMFWVKSLGKLSRNKSISCVFMTRIAMVKVKSPDSDEASPALTYAAGDESQFT